MPLRQLLTLYIHTDLQQTERSRMADKRPNAMTREEGVCHLVQVPLSVVYSPKPVSLAIALPVALPKRPISSPLGMPISHLVASPTLPDVLTATSIRLVVFIGGPPAAQVLSLATTVMPVASAPSWYAHGTSSYDVTGHWLRARFN